MSRLGGALDLAGQVHAIIRRPVQMGNRQITHVPRDVLDSGRLFLNTSESFLSSFVVASLVFFYLISFYIVSQQKRKVC